MKLDRTTYEAWLLDRAEGTLTPAQERELDAFLAANPDLNAAMGELPSVGGETLPFDRKAELKKSFPPTGKVDAARLNDFLVALHEGELPGPQAMDLERYLYEHPEAARDAKLMNKSRVPDDPVAYGEKGSIGRHFPPQGMPDKHRLTDFLIASREGDLSPDQGQALTAFLIAHPEARRDERLVAATYMAAERIVFADKEGLKKREARVIVLWQRYAVAASIALLLGFAWWVMRGDSSDAPTMARKEKVKQIVPEKSTTQGPEPETKEQGPQGPGTETLREQKREGTAGSRGGDPAGKKELAPTVVPDAPAPEPQFVESPMPNQQEQAPVLAQDPAPAPTVEDQGTQGTVPEQVPPAMASVDASGTGGTPIGTVLANTVRSGVIETGTRNGGLDREDALAMVDRGLGAITGGQGGVEVERKPSRDRWKVRLGRNLAISASTGR